MSNFVNCKCDGYDYIINMNNVSYIEPDGDEYEVYFQNGTTTYLIVEREAIDTYLNSLSKETKSSP